MFQVHCTPLPVQFQRTCENTPRELAVLSVSVRPATRSRFPIQGGGFLEDLRAKNRIDLAAAETIAPGDSKTFKFSVDAPVNGGQYPFQWRMSQGTASFGQASPPLTIPVVVKQHAARYVSQSVPTTVKAGSTFTVKVTMRNVGTNTWTQAGGYRLAIVDGSWGVSSVPLAVSDNVARGQDKVFSITCTAPATPGHYTIRWQMRRQSTAFTGFFGDKTTTKGIDVVP